MIFAIIINKGKMMSEGYGRIKNRILTIIGVEGHAVIDHIDNKDAEIKRLRTALMNIKKHHEIMGRDVDYKMSSTWMIADKALNNGESNE